MDPAVTALNMMSATHFVDCVLRQKYQVCVLVLHFRFEFILWRVCRL